MFTQIKNYFAPPVFPDKPEDTYLARIIQNVLLFSAGLLAFAMLLVIYIGLVRRAVPQGAALQALTIIGVGFVALIFAAYLLRKGRPSIAGALVAWTVGIVVVLAILRGGDIARPVLFTNAFALVVAGLMVRRRGMIFVATALFAAITVALLAINTRVPAAPAPPLSYALVDIFILFSMAVLLEFSNRNLYGVLRRTVASERGLVEKNMMLSTLTRDLEAKVDERTAELRMASAQIENRASQFAAIVEIARSISSVRDIDLLLPQVAEVVSRRFGFYHAGIFLIDDRHEFAVLRAASSEGGARMLDRNHRLRVGAQGIVGYVAQSGAPRVAADVGADAVFFNNPDLPETHSELALPLLVASQVIGVLDVQSDQRAAFAAEDVEVLSALASQVSIAIENARLFSQTRQALAEVERATRQSTRTAWQQFTDEAEIIGYRYSGRTPVVLGAHERSPELEQAASSGESATSARALAVPIKLRGQTIGVLGLKARSEDRGWDENDFIVARAAADRVALALENARLVSTAQRRAAKERLIGEISAKITATSDLDSVIQTAVEELGRSLPGAEVAIQFQSDTE